MRRDAVRRTLLAVAVILPSSPRAQQPPEQPPDAAKQESADLAKQLSNPVASLVSVPFQFNWEQNLPSTSEPALGSGKWSAGPTIIALKPEGSWTIGMLWNQVGSFSGDPGRSDVNQMFLQPFLSYQATHTITLTLQSETTANWDAADDVDRWTVPINMSVSELAVTSLNRTQASAPCAARLRERRQR